MADRFDVTPIQRAHIPRCRLAAAAVFAVAAIALLPGCSGSSSDSSADDAGEGVTVQAVEEIRVTLGGEQFMLETALDPESRLLGLSFREQIDPQGGMIFVFPFADRQGFVMRDCLVPIDIVYVADNNRIVRAHEMQVNPRRPGEGDAAYERRLKRYQSGAPVRVVLEFAGGTIDRLGIEPGDQVAIDKLDELKARAE